MATVINNPPPNERRDRTVIESDSSGWAVSVIILLLIIAGAFFWWLYARGPTPELTPTADQPGANINVSIPTTNIISTSSPTSGTSTR